MKQIYTVLFCLISMISLSEGMHISGVVKDIDTKKPVDAAVVTIKFYAGFEYSDITDSLGNFDIKTTAIVPEGDYTILLTAKNYWSTAGFVHVTKECSRNFFIKAKAQDTAKLEAKRIETPVVNKKDSVTLIVGVKDLPKTELDGYATNNLVFLIDISSSMNSPEKMPLLKESMKYLVSELRETDRVAILTFSKYVKEVLPSTAAANKNSIYKIIDELTFGSTSQGGAALEVAYKAASKNFVQKGNNRIVLASDGVFTSGESDYKKMQQLIESGLDKKISLSIFCFGKNTEYVKIKLKKLTSAGNGNFATITTIEEAKQRMMEEAKAVKE